jgi:hypothetical protein
MAILIECNFRMVLILFEEISKLLLGEVYVVVEEEGFPIR